MKKSTTHSPENMVYSSFIREFIKDLLIKRLHFHVVINHVGDCFAKIEWLT